MNLYLIVHTILSFHILGISLKASNALSSCEKSPSTVEIVEHCPDSEPDWREAAARKNCSAYANQCDEPERLFYHCVINAYSNQTFEVCAYGRVIFGGFCTVYSKSGNWIGESHMAKGSNCPNVYNSTEAYKCQGCYDMTKNKPMDHMLKETAPDTSTNNITQIESESADHDSLDENDDHQSSDITWTIVGVSLIVVIICSVIVCWYKKCCCFKKSHIK